ncbi:MAG: Obg family GTPase CgtA [Erysipelotrichaceae bacterium]|nr:MAG: Obg family GTPase [Erysipelotrichaceae bacterium]TXT17881.1 MAG: Obg family GTPase CgtA [Erysipelotrichaceae bacterium]
MFIDRVKIKVKAGTGGNGMTSFRREKYEPLGGPYGGDGGDGGSIIFEVDTNKSTLLDLRFNKLIEAPSGGNGSNKKFHGAQGQDYVVRVPLGTIIKDIKNDVIVADLVRIDQKVVVAQGGRGGRGNFHFKTSRNPAPDYCEKGEPGEEKELSLELKLLADAGLIGYPSVGKSTFLSVVSKATPEIAAYPFTTLVPNLGVVQVSEGDSFVLADLPGLIEGAHQGKGLGHMFLRHIERCRVLIHIIDMGAEDGRDPLNDYQVINDELKQYQLRLTERPQVVVANKMDLPAAKANLKRFKKAYPDLEIFETVTLIQEGVQPVLYEVSKLLKATPEFILNETQRDEMVYKFVEQVPFTIQKMDDHTWILKGDDLERAFAMSDIKSDAGSVRFARRLKLLGVDVALRKAGAKDGDLVYIKDLQFVYLD